ncbi:MAG TPA: hypothetical protein VFI39_03390 [Gemmatimonadales bacterium]|nr:hypothetical protein [Gemmatimonadales bacterium]
MSDTVAALKWWAWDDSGTAFIGGWCHVAVEARSDAAPSPCPPSGARRR